MTHYTLQTLERQEAGAVHLGIIWRGVVVVLGSNITGIIVANALGVLLGNMLADSGKDLSPSMITALSYAGVALSVLIGIAFIYINLRWLLSVRLGNYRLVLVRNEPGMNSERDTK